MGRMQGVQYRCNGGVGDRKVRFKEVAMFYYGLSDKA